MGLIRDAVMVRRALKRFLTDESGPAMVEYGLLLVFIALVVLAAASALGAGLSDFFTTTAGLF